MQSLLPRAASDCRLQLAQGPGRLLRAIREKEKKSNSFLGISSNFEIQTLEINVSADRIRVVCLSQSCVVFVPARGFQLFVTLVVSTHGPWALRSLTRSYTHSQPQGCKLQQCCKRSKVFVFLSNHAYNIASLTP